DVGVILLNAENKLIERVPLVFRQPADCAEIHEDRAAIHAVNEYIARMRVSVENPIEKYLFQIGKQDGSGEFTAVHFKESEKILPLSDAFSVQVFQDNQFIIAEFCIDFWNFQVMVASLHD